MDGPDHDEICVSGSRRFLITVQQVKHPCIRHSFIEAKGPDSFLIS